MQDIFLDRGANPPHGISGEAKAALRIKALDRLHHADIALGDQFRDRQAIAAIPHGDLGDQPQMTGDQAMRGLGILMLAPTAGEHVFLVRFQHRELANILQIAREISLGADHRHGC